MLKLLLFREWLLGQVVEDDEDKDKQNDDNETELLLSQSVCWTVGRMFGTRTNQ